jgi:hypothetical protein
MSGAHRQCARRAGRHAHAICAHPAPLARRRAAGWGRPGAAGQPRHRHTALGCRLSGGVPPAAKADRGRSPARPGAAQCFAGGRGRAVL